MKIMTNLQIAPRSLQEIKPNFLRHLRELAYSAGSVKRLGRLVDRMSDWLADEGLGISDLRPSDLDGFHAELASVGKTSPTTKASMPLIRYLRDIGYELEESRPEPVGAACVLAQRFRDYLVSERNLLGETADRYRLLIMPLLNEQAAAIRVEPEIHIAISEADVVRWVVTTCPTMSAGVAPLFVTALRALLSFLHLHGAIDRPLVGAVPTVPGRRARGLPKGVEADVVDSLLASCDHSTRLGARSFAVIVLLTRLGLRAGEVARLQLDDIDWRKGEISIVRGKSGRRETLPLPSDVGKPLADYLRRWRPATAIGRSVFVRLHAPHGALNRASVAHIVVGAAQRCALKPIYPHTLRHTAATQMLRRGASLREVGQVLGHRHTITTTIYAKVDREALRSIARAWPGDVA